MDVYNKAFDADAQEMIHRIGDYGASLEFQERFRTPLGQRTKPEAESSAQDESSLESAPVFHAPILTQVRSYRFQVAGRRLETHSFSLRPETSNLKPCNLFLLLDSVVALPGADAQIRPVGD